MNNHTWIEDPEQIKSPQISPVIHTTLKTLEVIKEKFIKCSKPCWHRTEFRCIIVVARILEVNPPVVVLSDNTAILVHEPKPDFFEENLFLRSIYYRFVFNLTPFSPDRLIILRAEPVTAWEIGVHLHSVVSE